MKQPIRVSWFVLTDNGVITFHDSATARRYYYETDSAYALRIGATLRESVKLLGR